MIQKTPSGRAGGGFSFHKSLTMTYFHRRTSTIIGAKAFHGPVRDGKEWDHLAMVVKRNRVFWRLCRPTERIWEEAPRLAGLARGVIKVWVHTRRTGRECCAPVYARRGLLICLNETGRAQV